MSRAVKHLQIMGAIAALGGLLAGGEPEPAHRKRDETEAHQQLRESRKQRRARQRKARKANRK